MERQKFCNTVEAKTNLNQYLDRVAQGQVVVISRRGKAVAKIVPADANTLDDTQATKNFMQRLRKFHTRVQKAHGRKSHTVSLLRELRRES